VSDQKQPGNPLSEPDSEPPREEPVGEVSDQTASLSDQETAGKPHPEPGSASSGKAACPISLDVLDNPRPSGYEELRTGSLREDPARGTVAGERTPNGTHGAMKPTLADLAATARAAQQARDLASLSSLPTPERDLLTDLLQTFDGVLVTEETTK